MARYAITIFLSAFLLFQVQPLIGKFILPWFGGSPAVWTTCMLFFQVALLAGYSYAHFITSRLSQRAQMICHLSLLIASLAFLPIRPDPDFWKQHTEEMPIGQILALLAVTIGLPYFLLSTTGPLLQESFRRETGHPPYRLYSLSNVGSLLALLSYPFAFEPALKLHTQIWGWSIGYVLFVVMCGWCALRFTKPAHAIVVEPGSPEAEEQQSGKPTWRDILLWLSLAACGSVMLLATTNQLCQEISAVPFLWVLPLAIYLITFIFCFDHERWYHHNLFLVLLTVSVLAACYAMYKGTALGMWTQLAIYSFTLWVCCMVCHGELVRAKPAPNYATLFYLMVSAGGAVGGILVAIVAPLVLRDYWEYHLALIATIVLAFCATFRGSTRSIGRGQARWVAGGGFTVALALALGWGISSFKGKSTFLETNLETTRNFYGVLHVNLEENPRDGNGPKRELINGRIQHGFQYLDPEKSQWPTTYYGHPSGIGLAIEYHPRRSTGPLRIGVVGLGCGTLAVYGQPGDTVRFYEINPEVIRVSDEYFTYRRDSAANVEVVLGDARIKMEQELATDNPQQFDVLAIDAFSSDSIPMHLLTLECLRLFRDHLKPDGILCLHISNRFLDLSGVARGIAQELGYECVMIDSDEDSTEGRDYSSWAILTTNQEFLDTPAVSEAIRPWNDKDGPLIIWTDDYGSLWQAISR